MKIDQSWKLLRRGAFTLEKGTSQSINEIESWWKQIPQVDKKKMLEATLEATQKEVRDLENVISML